MLTLNSKRITLDIISQRMFLLSNSRRIMEISMHQLLFLFANSETSSRTPAANGATIEAGFRWMFEDNGPGRNRSLSLPQQSC